MCLRLCACKPQHNVRLQARMVSPVNLVALVNVSVILVSVLIIRLSLNLPGTTAILECTSLLTRSYSHLIPSCSGMYHFIRSQSLLKLYVAFNMLEFLERLWRSLERDVFDDLHSRAITIFPQIFQIHLLHKLRYVHTPTQSTLLKSPPPSRNSHIRGENAHGHDGTADPYDIPTTHSAGNATHGPTVHAQVQHANKATDWDTPGTEEEMLRYRRSAVASQRGNVTQKIIENPEGSIALSARRRLPLSAPQMIRFVVSYCVSNKCASKEQCHPSHAHRPSLLLLACTQYICRWPRDVQFCTQVLTCVEASSCALR